MLLKANMGCKYLLVCFFSLYREIAESLSWLLNSRVPTFGRTGNVSIVEGCGSASWPSFM